MARPALSSGKLQEARVSEWAPNSSFGYLGQGRNRIFLHRRDFVRWEGPPSVGDRILYIPGTDGAGRRCAIQAECVRILPRINLGPSLLLVLLLIVPLTAAWVYGLTSLPWLAFFAVINLITWRCYAIDKRRAQAGAWRIPESTLHLLELAAGWPAALLAQRWLRHKCAKKSYQTTYWLIIALYQWAAWDSLHRWNYSLMAWARIAAAFDV